MKFHEIFSGGYDFYQPDFQAEQTPPRSPMDDLSQQLSQASVQASREFYNFSHDVLNERKFYYGHYD